MGVTRIQHNLSAMNSMSNYQGNQNALTNNLEKLSSGYRINSAADDAAGLAISEKMRSQIAGLEKAQDNANDGISLIQTAEGALTEVNSMLTRLKSLATQSANGTYEDGVDRANIQEETNALLDEIDRISQSTNFNGINLLDGSMSEGGIKHTEADLTINGISTTAMASTDPTATLCSITMTNGNANVGDSQIVKFEFKDEAGVTKTASIAFEAGADATATTLNMADAINKDAVLGSHFKASVDENDNLQIESKVKAQEAAADGADITTGAATITSVVVKTPTGSDVSVGTPNMTANGGVTATKTYDLSSLNDGDRVQINGKNYTYRKDEADVKKATDFHTGKQLASMSQAITVDATNATAAANSLDAIVVSDQFAAGESLTLQVGDTNKDYQKVSVDIKDMSSTGLGLAGLDLSTQEGAAQAIDTIQTAVNAVSTQRGKLGALQNRLDHTLNNLDATTQNITAAESQIRDVDMAKEMTQYSKNNILVQAAQSMLAQANSLPQGVLSLLQ